MTRPQWVNIEDEGALGSLLRRLDMEVSAHRIDELWIFPTRRAAGAESTVVVLSAFAAEPDRRHVGTVHFRVVRDRKGAASVEHELRDVATAPADAVSRVVDGVLHRLGDDLSQTPRFESIAGDAERFESLVRELGGAPKPADRGPVADPGGTDTGPAPRPGAADTVAPAHEGGELRAGEADPGPRAADPEAR